MYVYMIHMFTQVVEVSDWIIVVVFTLEFLLKLVALGVCVCVEWFLSDV